MSSDISTNSLNVDAITEQLESLNDDQLKALLAAVQKEKGKREKVVKEQEAAAKAAAEAAALEVLAKKLRDGRAAKEVIRKAALAADLAKTPYTPPPADPAFERNIRFGLELSSGHRLATVVTDPKTGISVETSNINIIYGPHLLQERKNDRAIKAIPPDTTTEILAGAFEDAVIELASANLPDPKATPTPPIVKLLTPSVTLPRIARAISRAATMAYNKGGSSLGSKNGIVEVARFITPEIPYSELGHFAVGYVVPRETAYKMELELKRNGEHVSIKYDPAVTIKGLSLITVVARDAEVEEKIISLYPNPIRRATTTVNNKQQVEVHLRAG